MVKKYRRSSYKNRNHIKKNLVDFILISLIKMTEAYQELKNPFGLVSNYHRLIYGRSFTKKEKEQYQKALNYCLKRQYLTKNKQTIKLNKKIKEQLKRKNPYIFYKKQDWDKKFRLVIFDIQESERKKRNQLRQFLKQLNFVLIQKSVWLTPLNEFKTLKLWLKEQKLNKEVILIETKNIEFRNKNKILSLFFQ